MADFQVDTHDSLVELLRTMDLRPLVELLGALAGLDLHDRNDRELAVVVRSEDLATLRNVLIDTLAARGIVIEDSIRARIEQCRDVETLARWCTRASSFTNGSLAEQLV
jgi:hypothetical protein